MVLDCFLKIWTQNTCISILIYRSVRLISDFRIMRKPPRSVVEPHHFQDHYFVLVSFSVPWRHKFWQNKFIFCDNSILRWSSSRRIWLENFQIWNPMAKIRSWKTSNQSCFGCSFSLSSFAEGTKIWSPYGLAQGFKIMQEGFALGGSYCAKDK